MNALSRIGLTRSGSLFVGAVHERALRAEELERAQGLGRRLAVRASGLRAISARARSAAEPLAELFSSLLWR